MYKRGQFFLIAALIAAGVLFGLTSVVNTAQVGSSQEGFYRLSDEINFEAKRVLDYGTYYNQDTDAVLKEFLSTYSSYIAEEKVIFIFGNKDSLQGLFYRIEPSGSAGISTGAEPVLLPIQDIAEDALEVRPTSTGVEATINGIPYRFNLREGQNFFFVIIKEENHEEFVATN